MAVRCYLDYHKKAFLLCFDALNLLCNPLDPACPDDGEPLQLD
ncbi:MAG: hypothetical protein RLZZ435_190 [Cyanobacteriota bacterium]